MYACLRPTQGPNKSAINDEVLTFTATTTPKGASAWILFFASRTLNKPDNNTHSFTFERSPDKGHTPRSPRVLRMHYRPTVALHTYLLPHAEVAVAPQVVRGAVEAEERGFCNLSAPLLRSLRAHVARERLAGLAGKLRFHKKTYCHGSAAKSVAQGVRC